jgi:hypothetical protein
MQGRLLNRFIEVELLKQAKCFKVKEYYILMTRIHLYEGMLGIQSNSSLRPGAGGSGL